MTDDELSKLQVLCDAATPGPWGVGNQQERPKVTGYPIAWNGCEMAITERRSDATFAAAAREAVPKLIAEARRLRGLVIGTQEACRQLLADRDVFYAERARLEQERDRYRAAIEKIAAFELTSYSQPTYQHVIDARKALGEP